MEVYKIKDNVLKGGSRIVVFAFSEVALKALITSDIVYQI